MTKIPPSLSLRSGERGRSLRLDRQWRVRLGRNTEVRGEVGYSNLN